MQQVISSSRCPLKLCCNRSRKTASFQVLDSRALDMPWFRSIVCQGAISARSDQSKTLDTTFTISININPTSTAAPMYLPKTGTAFEFTCNRLNVSPAGGSTPLAIGARLSFPPIMFDIGVLWVGTRLAVDWVELPSWEVPSEA